MSKNQTLSLRNQWLGERLKAARLAAGLKLRDAADQLQLAEGTLSRFEHGALHIRRPYLKELIDFYGIASRREREALIQLNEDAWRKDWWDGDTGDLETGFIDFTWLESRVTRICQFQTMLVPGLLQAPDYARELITNGYKGQPNEDAIARLLDLRLQRQRILSKEAPTGFSIVLEEPAIRRPIGGAATLRAQLRHLVELNKREHIHIRVLPASTGWHPSLGGSFTLFDMPDPYPNVAYLEGASGRTFIEDEAKVQRFREAYDDLYRMALPGEESTRFIEDVSKELA